MLLHKPAKRLLCYGVALAFLGAGVQAPAQAALVSTNQLAAEASQQQQRSELKSFMSRDAVKHQMVALGVEPTEALKRVDSLTDREVADLHQRVGELPAGGDALGTIAIVLVILILLDLTGLTDIFPRI